MHITPRTFARGAVITVVGGVPDSYRMTPFRVLLSDQAIADIATFVRTSWGNNGLWRGDGPSASNADATDPTSDHVIVLRLR